ncbi:tetratricopeptide repeat protein [Flavobacterium sp. HNIBRBA15423]|uniref:tetratricopeptide repeat protein n=1 Tax=Flavobacterium sp. HNIBRBA15423 TaxID=3458683 RepID=UPI0040441734
MKSIDKYLFQAMDNYPYCLEETIESLDYALSYDDKNTTALCLYARIQAEQLLNYEEAKNYFQQALGININAIEVYPYYIQTLLSNEDFEEAEKLIHFALTIKGINKVEILMKKIQLHETKREFKEAKQFLKEVKLTVINNEYNYYLDETKARIKGKLELLKPKKEKEKKAKKNKKKKGC